MIDWKSDTDPAPICRARLPRERQAFVIEIGNATLAVVIHMGDGTPAGIVIENARFFDTPERAKEAVKRVAWRR